MYIIIITDLASLLVTRNTARVLMPPEKIRGPLYIQIKFISYHFSKHKVEKN